MATCTKSEAVTGYQLPCAVTVTPSDLLHTHADIAKHTHHGTSFPGGVSQAVVGQQ